MMPEREGIQLYAKDGCAVLRSSEHMRAIDGSVHLSFDDLAWLCLVAGPTVLAELAKQANAAETT